MRFNRNLTLTAGMIMHLRSRHARLRRRLARHTNTNRVKNGTAGLHLRLAEMLRSRLTRLSLRLTELQRSGFTRFHLRLTGLQRSGFTRFHLRLTGLHEMRLTGLELRATMLRPLSQGYRSGGQNCDGCKNVFHS